LLAAKFAKFWFKMMLPTASVFHAPPKA